MPLTRNIQGHDLSFAVAIVQRRHTRASPQAHTQRRKLQIEQMGGQGGMVQEMCLEVVIHRTKTASAAPNM